MTDCSSGNPNNRILVVFMDDMPFLMRMLTPLELQIVPSNTFSCSTGPSYMLSSEMSSVN